MFLYHELWHEKICVLFVCPRVCLKQFVRAAIPSLSMFPSRPASCNCWQWMHEEMTEQTRHTLPLLQDTSNNLPTVCMSQTRSGIFRCTNPDDFFSCIHSSNSSKHPYKFLAPATSCSNEFCYLAFLILSNSFMNQFEFL